MPPAKIITYISDWIILLPFLVGAVIYKKLQWDSRIIFFMVFLGITPQMLHFFYNHSLIETISYNIYIPFEFTLLGILFYKQVSKRNTKLTLTVTYLFYAILSIYFFTQVGITGKFISEWILTNNLLYLFWIGLFLYETFQFDSGELTLHRPFFWYLIGILIYSACASIVFSLWHKILSSEKNSILKYLWSVQNICNIIMYLLFTVGLFLEFRNSKRKLPEC